MAKTKIVTSLPDLEEHPVVVTRDDSDSSFRVVTAADADGAKAPTSAPARGPLVIPRGSDVFTVFVDGASFEALVEQDEGEYSVQVGAERYRFRIGADATAGAHRSRAGGRHELKAPMPGKVVKLLVVAGQQVTAGQGVVLFEAMKMQNEIRSPGDGRVVELLVEEGAAVEAKAPLLSLELN